MKTTKYFLLMQAIKDRLASGELGPGDKLSSENELCREFSISRQTVRQAMSLLESEGLLERRRGSGTYVTGKVTPVRQKTMSVGVITSYLDNHIFPLQTHGVEQVLSSNGYTMQLGITYNKLQNEANAINSMLEKNVDGMIIEPSRSALPTLNRGLYLEIKRSGIPAVFVNTSIPGIDLPLIALDDRRGGYIAAKHLIECGHRRIGAVLKDDDGQGRLRYLGFMDAMNEYGLLYNEASVLWMSTEDLHYITDGCLDLFIMRRLQDCTGLVCYNDPVAFDIIELLGRMGVNVPGDMSVVGYDNSNISTLCKPQLTTIAHPTEKLGEMAARNLIALMDDPGFDAQYIFSPYLVQRDSVQPLR